MPSSKYQNPLFILALASISCFLWGSAFPSIKYSFSILEISNASSIVKMQFAGYRFLIAGIYLFILILILQKPLLIPKDYIPRVVILGIFQTSIQYYLFYNGLANVTGVKGSIITSLGTFFSVIFPHFYYKNENWSFQKLFGLMLGFCGVVYINLAKGSITGAFSLTGEGFLILGAIISAASSILAKETSRKVDSLIMTCYQMLIGSIIMLTFSLQKGGGNLINFNYKMMPVFLYLSLISAVGFSLWFLLITHNNISKVAIYRFQIPIWGSILSAIFIPNESLSFSTIMALIPVSLGIMLVNMPEFKFFGNRNSHQ